MASSATRTNGQRPAARPSGRPRPTNMAPGTRPDPIRPSRITEADKTATKSISALHRALAIARRIGDGQVLCPDCNEWAQVEKKFKMFEDGGWKHFGSSGCHGDAIKVLQAEPLNLNFVDAVCALVGKPTRAKVDMPTGDLPPLNVATFRAKVDPEVYNGILIYGRKALDGAGVKAAQEFYGQWHIDAQAVADAGAVYITDPKHFSEAILARFGRERLIACGLFKENDQGEAYCLVSKKWPVVEPHRHPATGDVLNIQFRASNEQYAQYLRHKAGELSYDGNQKFINLRGIPPKAQIGVGLEEIDKLPPGQTVYIVEGFKDKLAARTTGAYAYGVPGVDFRPDPKICALLARHNVVVSLDGDGAGAKGIHGAVELTGPDGNPVLTGEGKPLRAANHPDHIPAGCTVSKVVSKGLLEYLREHGVTASYYQIPGGMDVTDRVIAKHAQAGCGCAACVSMRTRLAATA